MRTSAPDGGVRYREPVSGARILVAEDNDMQAEVIRRYLVQDGHTVRVVRDGQAAIDEVRDQAPDLLVLDVMMPRVDGHEVCRVVRRESDLPILVLTARSSEDDLLEGLALGADDYMTKPFSPRELTARVRTLLRRLPRSAESPGPEDAVITVGDLVIDGPRRQVRLDGRTADCTPDEFDIMVALAAWPGMVLSRQQLLDHSSRIDRRATERTIDVHVRNLRKKLEADPSRPEWILTAYGVGYRLFDGRARSTRASGPSGREA